MPPLEGANRQHRQILPQLAYNEYTMMWQTPQEKGRKLQSLRPFYTILYNVYDYW